MPEQRNGTFFSRRIPALVVLGFFVFISAEVSLLVLVSTQIGWWTLVALMISMLLGVYLLQREWRKAWKHLSQSLSTGSLPTGRTADAALVLMGGFMLIMPGFITDIIGLLLLLPFTRPVVRSMLGGWAGRIVSGHNEAPRTDVIRGEVVEDNTDGPTSDPQSPSISPRKDEPNSS